MEAIQSTGPGRTNPFAAEMVVKYDLTKREPTGEPRDVIHTEFDISGSEYEDSGRPKRKLTDDAP